MSVEDEYTEHKNALSRASMTLTDWIDEVFEEITPEWVSGNIADPVALLSELAVAWQSALSIDSIVNEAFWSVIKEEANRRMQLARDKYEEEYGRRP